MGGDTTIVVGTDGSQTSFAAVDRAARLAADAGATLVIACAYEPQRGHDVERAQDILGPDAAYQVVGSAPADESLRTASERAHAAAADVKVETTAISGKPDAVLQQVVRERNADLLVVGNRGLNTLAGRLIGSVPLDVLRHTPVDVLVVHTT
ncbi:MAG: universal stress protein [Jatrophihabitans sp.]|uniref:universal stress protein n=1 Tax=Jatrophihabitans sp. TaxID=1932789 RepID=UPI003F7DE1D2